MENKSKNSDKMISSSSENMDIINQIFTDLNNEDYKHQNMIVQHNISDIRPRITRPPIRF